MAGIGFTLRKLARKDDIMGVVQGYFFSAIVYTGPWLFTIFSLGMLMQLGSKYLLVEEMATFRLIIIYNFAFSLVLSAPIYMVATRFLADIIYAKDVSKAPGMFFGSMILLYGIQVPLAAMFYLWYANLELWTGISAFINYCLIAGIWLISTFLTALKAFRFVTSAFGVGMFIAMICSAILASEYSVGGMLLGYSIGLTFIYFSLIARIFVEYPYQIKHVFDILEYFKKYWELALSGLVYNMAIWVDKWIMWFCPEREKLYSGLVSFPNYDSAMFLAFLTIVPAMALFVFSIETQFFERYLRFYRDIQQHATYVRIEKNHQGIIESIVEGSRNLFVLQGSLGFALILIAPTIFTMFEINFLQLGIFRFGVLGAMFHVLTLYLTIILSYFDFRGVVLGIQIIFLVTNTIFSLISMNLGFLFYGYGYFLAAVVTFVSAFIITLYYLYQLPFQSFIGHNTSIN